MRAGGSTGAGAAIARRRTGRAAARGGRSAGSGPAEDRVGFPDYSGFTLLRTFYGAQQRRVGIVLANAQAASVTDLANVPYPYGSIFVVEWRRALTDPAGSPLRDSAGEDRVRLEQNELLNCQGECIKGVAGWRDLNRVHDSADAAHANPGSPAKAPR